MKDEELIGGLIDAARKPDSENARIDKEFDDLAASKLSKEQIKELSMKYKDSSQGALALDLFAPMSNRVRERIVQQLKSEVGAQKRQRDKSPGIVIRLKSWMFEQKRILQLATSAAAVVVLMFVVWNPDAQWPAIPAYQMSLQGQIKAVRGAEHEITQPDELPRYKPGSILQVVLRPDRAVQGPVEVSVFIEKDGHLSPIDLPVEQDPQGSVRIFGKLGKDVHLPSGAITLWMCLSRPGEKPTPEQIQTLKAKDSNLVMKTRFIVEAK